MARGALLLTSLLLLCASPAFADKVPDLDTAVHTIETDIGNVESGVRRLEAEIVNPVAESRFYSLQKRLVDAHVYFELKNYANAAVLYIDAVQNPNFATSPDAVDVLLNLGYCLYKLKNYVAAREYLDQLLGRTSGDRYQRALRFVLEIGLESRTNEGLEAAVQKAAAFSPRSPALTFSYAKGLYRLGRTADALGVIATIPAGVPEYAAAQYYAGVVWTGRQKYSEAIACFQQVVATKGKKKNLAKIRELANLALGRLYLERGENGRAVDAYQEIDRHSEHFHTALYEMTWGYVHEKQYDKALNALEILLLTVDDDALATKANVLRGRLNMLLDQTELAVDTYNEIVQRFSPLKDELDAFAREASNLNGYFRWLLDRHADVFVIGSVLSERANRFIETDDELKDVVTVFDDMSRERHDVKEAEEILAELENALQGGQGLVEIFPNLKNAWVRITLAENRFVALSGALVDAEERLAPGGGDAQAAESARAERRKLEAQFAALPKTSAEYGARKGRVNKRFGDLRRDAFVLEQHLKQVRDQVQAMEKWVKDARFADKETRLTGDEEKKVLAEIEQERELMKQLHQELASLESRIAFENARVGAGDSVARDEAALKKRVLAAQDALEAALGLERLGGGARTTADQARALRKRIMDDLGRLSRLLVKIDHAVEVKVAEFRGQVQAEKVLLAGYRQDVDGFDKESERIAQDIGVPLFKLAHKHLSEVVLEADLGLVDVAWKRKRAESEKIMALQKEQSEQVKTLESTMQSILKD